MFIKKTVPSSSEATKIAALGFVREYSPELQRDVEEHLAHGDVYTFIQDKQEVGFAIFNMTDPETLYLAGIILRPEVQGIGLAAQVIGLAQEETRAKKFTLRTQSLRMWMVGNRLCKTWYPQPYFEAGRRLETLFPQGDSYFYPLDIKGDSKLLRSFYGGPLYGQKPVYHDHNLQKWWDEICDFERGDAVFCCGTF